MHAFVWGRSVAGCPATHVLLHCLSHNMARLIEHAGPRGSMKYKYLYHLALHSSTAEHNPYPSTT